MLKPPKLWNPSAGYCIAHLISKLLRYMETNTERNDNKIYQLFRQDLHDEMLEMFDKFMAAADKRAEAKAMEMLFDEEQVKNTCKVSSTTLWRWAKSGYLTPIFVGGKKRWRRSDIMALIEQGGRA